MRIFLRSVRKIPEIAWAAAAAGLLLTLSIARADTLPQFYAFQGRLLDQAGVAPLTGMVGLQLGLYSPNGLCLLYEEYQGGIDLTATQGSFAVQLGSAAGDPKRT